MSETETVATTKKARSEGFIDQIGRVVVRDGVTYGLGDLPDHVVGYLALVGLDYKVRTGKDAYAKLKGGATQKAAAAHELDPWRLAVAHTIVEQSKKTISLDDAKAQAAEIDRTKLIELKKDPAVVKHWRKITGAPALSVLETLAKPVAKAEPAEMMQAAE